MTNNLEDINNVEDKNLSQELENLIKIANETIEKSETTIKQRLLDVYNQAIKENFTPLQARNIMKEKIKNVSDRYIRKILPQEAKRTYTTEIGTVPKLEDLQKKYNKDENITKEEFQPKKSLEEFRQKHRIDETIEDEEPKEVIDLTVMGLQKQNKKLESRIKELEKENTDLKNPFWIKIYVLIGKGMDLEALVNPKTKKCLELRRIN